MPKNGKNLFFDEILCYTGDIPKFSTFPTDFSTMGNHVSQWKTLLYEYTSFSKDMLFHPLDKWFFSCSKGFFSERKIFLHTFSCPASFDLPQTLDCGQAFRWCPAPAEQCDRWEGAAANHWLSIEKKGDSLLFTFPHKDDLSFWKTYFDLSQDYASLRQEIGALHPVLQKAADFAPGIRLLCQEPWETLCSFIISQNNHIPRIKGIIQRFCEAFGEPLPLPGWYSFPTPEKIASLSLEDLAPLRAGFRGKYLLDAARKVTAGEVDFSRITGEETDFGRKELQKILGVGPKVAECVLLFGFHKTECFPMDVWMKRAMETLLPGVTPQDLGPWAGLAQQYLFHYSRMHPQLFP